MRKPIIWIFIAMMLQQPFARAQLYPGKAYPDLLRAVQHNEIFQDAKTFVDCIPKEKPVVIRERFRRQNPPDEEALRAFVEKYFTIPEALPVPEAGGKDAGITAHIDQLWNVLQRSDSAQNPLSTRIALPKPYIVPGGRFREIYYWDSYFTMLGLQEAGKSQLIRDMVENFVFLLKEYGKIPNGNRTYYLSRSQPPFFALMVDLLAEVENEEVYAEFLPALQKEYAFWMDGRDQLQVSGDAVRRVVRMPDGSVLNRYWDEQAKPRPEAHLKDFMLAQQAQRNERELYRDIRAACESGWDFSSRWLADGHSMASINTTSIIPVDLNSLLHHLEQTLSKAFQRAGEPQKSRAFAQAAQQRATALNRYCYDEDSGFFVDYNFIVEQPTGVLSLAGMFPLYFNIASRKQAALVKQKLGVHFMYNGGAVTTLRLTGEQWDTPNGWAPLQWITIQGLRNYHFNGLASVIGQTWLRTNEFVFRNSGKMMEKYNVLCQDAEQGGGEYPTQDGFGWTNGVYVKLRALYR